MGVPYRVVASRYGEEDLPGFGPADLALEHARAKAREVAARGRVPEGGAVLGADTVVVLDGDALGKPADRAEAAAMLARLAGRRHTVVTAVCIVLGDGTERAFADEAGVTFRLFGPSLADWYLDRGEWQGRAGAYAIQGAGAVLVERVEGDFSTVVGLPVGRLAAELEHLGLAPWGTPPPE